MEEGEDREDEGVGDTGNAASVAEASKSADDSNVNDSNVNESKRPYFKVASSPERMEELLCTSKCVLAWCWVGTC